MNQKLMSLFQAHLKARHNLTLYPYQLDVAQKLFSALTQNLRLTVNATEADVKKLRIIEVPIEFSRQSGKTTAIVHAIEFIMLFFPELFKRPIRIGIFAPQREQAKTDFDRLKFALAKSTQLQVKLDDDPISEESNAKTIVLPNGASCYIFPVTATSKPESKTLDLIVFEESQDLDDRIIKEQIWPMGAATNAPRIYIGTAGTRLCYFRSLGQSGESLKLYYDQIVEQRRKVYLTTGDALHLIYEQSVKGEIEKHGRDADEIARPYFGKWLIGTGQYVTQEDLEAMVSERKRTFHDKQSDCFVGIDTAKHPDSTIVTVLRYDPQLKRKQIINWLELRGENYKDQFDIIHEFMKKYRVLAVAIDSTGQGDFMPDMFERESEWGDEQSGLYRVKFSAVSKDMIYKNLKVSIRELLTDLPKLDTREGERFKQQMLDLQQEYKGQLLSVHHPDDANAHDDYCFIAGTLVKTEDGDKPIEQIQVGDKVWTRKGYKNVYATSSRKAKVITRFGITGTPDHPFITPDGIKRFNELQESGTIYIWNERLSNIEAKIITAIQNRPKDSSEFTIGDTTNGKSRLNHYIGKFIWTIMGIFQGAGSYITKTKILSTTTLRIWKLCPEPSISQGIKPRKRDFNQLAIYPVTLDHWLPSGTVHQKAWLGTRNTPKKAYSSARTDPETTRADTYQTVYNISVADQSEYLANNILVHNCDSWALAEWAYAKYNEDNNAQVAMVSSEKERNVVKDDEGRTLEYWPGLEDGF